MSCIKIQFEPRGEHCLVPLEGPIDDRYAGN